MGKLFGTDGIRGLAGGETLTADIALRIGQAAAAVLGRSVKRPLFLIGNDTRGSGDMLESAIAAGLCSAGADVVLLGVAPTASTEDIEEAYQRKKKEFAEDAYRQQALESAYNEAIMATFAPIRAYSSPLPPLTTGKRGHRVIQAEPVQPEPVLPEPVVPPVTVHEPAQPEPVQPMPVEPQPWQETEVEDLVEDAPVSFTDTELLNMNVTELRESYTPQTQDENNETSFLSFGIENRLLRYYVRTYVAMVVFDMIMRLLVGPRWLVVTEIVSAEHMTPTPVLLSIAFAFVSIAYGFVCSLPAPFTVRFFILGQPPDKSAIVSALFFLSVVFAFLLRWLTWSFLPFNITGSVISFMVAAMVLSIGTLRYAGD